MEPENSPEISGRLQRAADFTGPTLTTFQEVFIRHGLPGALLGLFLLFALSSGSELLERSLDRAALEPYTYIVTALMLLSILFAYSGVKFKSWNLAQAGWVVYLGLLSLWEEWLFRVIGPHSLRELGVNPVAAVLLSNIVFGLMHYFTLRWRWQWCVGAFIGGLGFSSNFHNQGDLLLIAGIHWAVTYLNTPRPPAGGLLKRQ